MEVLLYSAKTDAFDSHILQKHFALCTESHGNEDQDVALFGEACEERWDMMPVGATQIPKSALAHELHGLLPVVGAV